MYFNSVYILRPRKNGTSFSGVKITEALRPNVHAMNSQFYFSLYFSSNGTVVVKKNESIMKKGYRDPVIMRIFT